MSEHDSESSASQISVSQNEKILNMFLKSIDWPIKTAWPNLVGDCIERATAIVEFGTPYYVVHKKFNKLNIARPDVFDCLRVIFYLDKDNYIAITPKVG